MSAEETRPDESEVPEPEAPEAVVPVDEIEDETEVVAHAEQAPWCVGNFG